MDAAADLFHSGLAALVESLDVDLRRLQQTSPGMASVLVQTTVTVLALEYLLRKKHLLERDEMLTAIAEAQQAIRHLAGQIGRAHV